MFALAAKLAAWFATSKVGRTVAAGGALALAIGVALIKAFSAGKAAQLAKEQKQALEDQRTRDKIDEDVRNTGDAELDRRVDRWVHDDK